MASPEQIAWTESFLSLMIPLGDGGSGALDASGSIIDRKAGSPDQEPKPLAPQTPVARVDLGPPEQKRAYELLATMPDAEKAKVEKLLADADASTKKYLTKALASKHSAAELGSFAQKIAGEDQAWRDENLHLVGLSTGSGIKQQWHDSCAPTAAQAMRGELDPIYALQLHEENTDITRVDDDQPTATNAAMAAEQKALLEGQGGIAVARSASGGRGVVMGTLFNSESDTLGMDFGVESITSDDEMAKGLDDAEAALKSGLPVPVRVGNGRDGHAVLMTGVDPGPPRRFGFHDPWNGKTLVFTAEQIATNNIDIAGWTKITHVYKPTVKDPP